MFVKLDSKLFADTELFFCSSTPFLQLDSNSAI